ncbi:MAG: hypothetical protein ACO2PN_08340 [Pyrobaculum sp.]|jgi:hypothetical protein
MAQNNSQVAANAAGAQAGARQQNPACRHVEQWINDYRSDLYVAVTLDKLVDMINDYLDTIGEKGKITKEDIKTCLRHDDTVRIVPVGDKEVLWLWHGWRLYNLIDKVAELAMKEGEVAVAAGI